jgi:hypothetical protein
MRQRSLLAFAALALAVGACGAGPDQSAGGPSHSQALAYSLTGDTVLTYHTDIESSATTKFDGMASLGASAPGSMNMQMEMSLDSTYQIGDGPEPGSYRVAMTTDNIALESGSVEIGGDKVDLSDVSQTDLKAALDAEMPEFVYILNDKGEVVSVEVGGVSIDVDGLLGGISASGLSSGQMFGPELPAGDVTIGDSWTTTSEQHLGDVVVGTEQTHKILRSEEHNGHQTWVIQTKSTTDGYTVTWDDITAMLDSMGGIDQVAGMEDMPEAFQMAMHASPSASTMITWLDPEVGRVVAVDNTTSVVMTIEMGGLPGMPGSFSMHVDGHNHVVMELVE